MATQNTTFEAVTESCEACGRETPHEVTIELQEESAKAQNAEFSREPYRVTECTECGATTSQRMNDA